MAVEAPLLTFEKQECLSAEQSQLVVTGSSSQETEDGGL